MFFIFRLYPHSPLATLVSVLGTFGSFAAAYAAILCFRNTDQSMAYAAGGVFMTAAALFLFFFVGRKCAGVIAMKSEKKNSTAAEECTGNSSVEDMDSAANCVRHDGSKENMK